MKLMKHGIISQTIVIAILSALYIIFSIITAFNWIILNFFKRTQLSITKILMLNIPSDLGCSIVMITIGLLLIYSLIVDSSLTKLISIFIASLLAISEATLQVLITLANYADSIITSGNQSSILASIIRPDVILGFILISLFVSSRTRLKELLTYVGNR